MFEDEIPRAREAAEERQRAQSGEGGTYRSARPAQTGADSGGERDQFTKIDPLRERISKNAQDITEKGRRLMRFADRLTPEIQETIEVLQEGIRLGVFSINGSLTL